LAESPQGYVQKEKHPRHRISKQKNCLAPTPAWGFFSVVLPTPAPQGVHISTLDLPVVTTCHSALVYPE